jgi:hypothetical protein
MFSLLSSQTCLTICFCVTLMFLNAGTLLRVTKTNHPGQTAAETQQVALCGLRLGSQQRCFAEH